MKRVWSWFALDHRSLGHQPLFWVAIFLPVTLFLFFGCLSWIGSSPQWNYEGFNHFIDRSKLPLGLLALALPFTALVTSWHRSIQTAKQIEDTQVKNTADLYYAHLKFFIERLEDNKLVGSPIQLHKTLYPNFSSSHYCLQKNEDILKGVSCLRASFTEALKEWLKEDSKSNFAPLLRLLQLAAEQKKQDLSAEWMSTHHLTSSVWDSISTKLNRGQENRVEQLCDKAYTDLDVLVDLVGM